MPLHTNGTDKLFCGKDAEKPMKVKILYIRVIH